MVAGFSDLTRQINELEARMDRLEEEMRKMRLEAERDRAKFNTVQVAIRKGVRELAII